MNAVRCCGLTCLLSVLSLILAAPTSAFQDKDKKSEDKKEEKKKKPNNTFTNAADAGPDYLVQGEYAGDKFAAQVVALGNGKFNVYFLTGGLPGAGWDTKGRVKTNAKTVESKTIIEDKVFSGTIADGKLTGKGPDGDFTLTKTERKSSTLGAKPPEGALILFDGSSAAEWGGGKIVEDNLLFCGPNSKKKFAAGKLHIEFRCPFQPTAGGQGRGNSGVYIQGKEVQVLDSFGLTGANNECGAFYSEAKPAVNMCLPPLAWQTYDVEIKEGDGKTVATVLHNGVKVHDDFVIQKRAPTPTSINLQNHGNPVVYRNIWWVEAK